MITVTPVGTGAAGASPTPTRRSPARPPRRPTARSSSEPRSPPWPRSSRPTRTPRPAATSAGSARPAPARTRTWSRRSSPCPPAAASPTSSPGPTARIYIGDVVATSPATVDPNYQQRIKDAGVSMDAYRAETRATLIDEALAAKVTNDAISVASVQREVSEIKIDTSRATPVPGPRSGPATSCTRRATPTRAAPARSRRPTPAGPSPSPRPR